MIQHCFFRNVQLTFRDMKRLCDCFVVRFCFEKHCLFSLCIQSSFFIGFCKAKTIAFSSVGMVHDLKRAITQSGLCLGTKDGFLVLSRLFVPVYFLKIILEFSREINHCMVHYSLKVQRTMLLHKLNCHCKQTVVCLD